MMREEVTPKKKSNGLTGLANLGNTCFVNSMLQCLLHTYELNNLLDNKQLWQKKIKKKPESLIFLEWNELRKMMWSEDCTISPAGFIQAVQKVANAKNQDIFTGFAQNDFTEFLHFCVSCFHSSLEREVNMEISGAIKNKTDKTAKICYDMMSNMYKKEYSEILQIFYGIHVSQTKSLENNYKNISPEPFFDLSLEMEGCNNLVECIDKYTSVEKLTGDNKLYNDKSKKYEEGEKRIQFFDLPDVLVITLKRFKNNNRKDQKMVDFPLEGLNFKKYMIGYDKSKYIYDLYGIANHSGNVLGGHYTSFVKIKNNDWYLFNDTEIRKVNNIDKIKTPKAYCFFYRKRKTNNHN
tara:strand:- start:434 stop:1486 length:1053 start_codon:yes stop_codon:yes gene_type:complete